LTQKTKQKNPAVIPVLGRQRQEDHEFEASLGYTRNLSKKGQRNKNLANFASVCEKISLI
jgi:hypothetical protein